MLQQRLYLRGTVEYYNQREGHGDIIPDDIIDGSIKRVFFHYRSVRDENDIPLQGERVLFYITNVLSGLRADDVHPEQVDSIDEQQSQEDVIGKIASYDKEKKTGLISVKDATNETRNVFFHSSYVTNQDIKLDIGTQIICRIVTNELGLQAQDITSRNLADSVDVAPSISTISASPDKNQKKPPSASIAQTETDWLVRALIARDKKNYDEAIRLYERGLRETPTLQLVLSYAATLRSINRGRDAMRIYEEGIRKNPNSAKLREDAGVLAARLGDYQKSRRLLREALDLINRSKQGGKKGVLLALARTSYQMNELDDSIEYYNELLPLDGRISKNLEFNLAKIRTQHHRGELAIRFFGELNFNILNANLQEVITEGATLIIEIADREYIESYGLAAKLLVRIVFKRDIALEDLTDLDKTLANESAQHLIDDQVILILTASLPNELEAVLRKRLDNKGRSNKPAIIPIQQEKIEAFLKGDEPNVLRNVLSDWLYRRDLFAGNRPVVGRRFFGRDEYLAQIRDTIDEGAFAGVFGLRKVGKTSLLQESQQRLTENGDFVIYRELGGLASESADCRRLYWEIATELREHLTKRFPRNAAIKEFNWRLGGVFEDYLDIEPSFPVPEAFDADLKRFFKLLNDLKLSTQPRVVLLLDEIERLIPIAGISNGFIGYFDFLSKLRAMNQQNPRLVLIVAGANPIISETSQFDQRDNPVFNYFKEIYLAFLERLESDTMVKQLGQGMGITFSRQALNYLYELTGGHPFIVRQVCSFIASRNHERPLHIARENIENEVESYLNYRGSDFNEIMDRLKRDFPAEYEICLALGAAGGHLPMTEIGKYRTKNTGEVVRHLSGYQIFREDGEYGYLTMDLLTRWLKNISGGK